MSRKSRRSREVDLSLPPYPRTLRHQAGPGLVGQQDRRQHRCSNANSHSKSHIRSPTPSHPIQHTLTTARHTDAMRSPYQMDKVKCTQMLIARIMPPRSPLLLAAMRNPFPLQPYFPPRLMVRRTGRIGTNRYPLHGPLSLVRSAALKSQELSTNRVRGCLRPTNEIHATRSLGVERHRRLSYQTPAPTTLPQPLLGGPVTLIS